MWDSVTSTVGEYYRFYVSYGARRWTNMSPMEYGTVLLTIAMLGWFLMKNTTRR